MNDPTDPTDPTGEPVEAGAASGPRGSVLVTGASSGIGRAVVDALLAEGFHVLATVRREESLAALQGHVDAARGRLDVLLVDLTDDAAVERLAEEVAAKLRQQGRSGLAGLVNNAGFTLAGPLELLPASQLREQYDVNVIAPFVLTRALLPLLRQGAGRVVNIGSISARFALPFLGPYAGSKAALLAMSDSLRAELRPWRLPVIVMELGRIDTPLWQKTDALGDQLWESVSAANRQKYEQRINRFRKLALSGSMTPVDKVARGVTRALTCARPRNIYRIGKGSQIVPWVARWVPVGLRNWAVATFVPGEADAG